VVDFVIETHLKIIYGIDLKFSRSEWTQSMVQQGVGAQEISINITEPRYTPKIPEVVSGIQVFKPSCKSASLPK